MITQNDVLKLSFHTETDIILNVAKEINHWLWRLDIRKNGCLKIASFKPMTFWTPYYTLNVCR